MSNKIVVWHFAPPSLERNGHAYAAVGVPEPELPGPVLCKRGYHGSESVLDALGYCQYLPAGPVVAERVELSGEIVRGEDKLAASRRTCIARLTPDATDGILRRAAITIAARAMWRYYPREGLHRRTVLRELGALGRITRVDDPAAWDAAWAAAWDAAWAAAGAAAGAAARGLIASRLLRAMGVKS